MNNKQIIEFENKYRTYDNRLLVKSYFRLQDLEAGYIAQSNPSFSAMHYEEMKQEEKYLMDEMAKRNISKELIISIRCEMKDEFINQF